MHSERRRRSRGGITELQFGPGRGAPIDHGQSLCDRGEKKCRLAAAPEVLAKEHGTPLQRAYNLGCIAYGADPKLFGDFVTNKYLPKKRADVCDEEYELVERAFEALIDPHIDHALADKI